MLRWSGSRRLHRVGLQQVLANYHSISASSYYYHQPCRYFNTPTIIPSNHRHPPFSPISRPSMTSTNVYSSTLKSIGNTALIKLKKASEITGCNIYGKAEFQNPGGSVKDRAALWIIRDAEERGILKPGQGIIVEGTAGNTGIGLALVGNARGYKTIMSDRHNQTNNPHISTRHNHSN